MAQTSAIVLIWVNCPDRAVAEAIADDLLGAGLAAATNIFPEIASRYVWKGEVRSAAEVPLVVKTHAELFDAVAARVQALHPYETPAILALEPARANADYLAWLCEVTAQT